MDTRNIHFLLTVGVVCLHVAAISINNESNINSTRETCKLPADTGPCKAGFARWYYDHTDGQCNLFVYGGCKGNENNFVTKDQCESRCKTPTRNVCNLPSKTGPCKASIPKWYFDPIDGQCKKFVYGGCKGNENNFDTKEECESQCSRPRPDVCKQPAERGPCLGYFPGWYHDINDGLCKEFVYGGCQGNDNYFLTKELCESECSGTTRAVCNLPSETGPCKEYIPKWYYDQNDSQCKVFVYGGCGGNENNFETKERCESRCGGKTQDVCKLGTETGPCKAFIIRWYHDYNDGQCKGFVYGGCKGNGNNFETKEQCESQCNSGICKEQCVDKDDCGPFGHPAPGACPNGMSCCWAMTKR